MSLEVANTIRNQIGGNTLMCVGASNFVADGDALRFRVRVDNQRRYIEVRLNGKDLYDCRQILVRGSKVRDTYRADDVYCDQLREVVYRLGSTRHVSEGFLEEVGIYEV